MHRAVAFEYLAVHPVQVHLHPVGDAAMRQRLGQRLIAVEQVGVLADDGDAHLALRRADRIDDVLPARQIRLALSRQIEMPQHFAIHALAVVADRHRIDRIDVERRDHRLRPHIAEQRDLAAFVLRDRPVAAAQQHLRLDADIQQLLHRVLRRLGLQFAGGRNVRHQRQVHEHRPLRPKLVAELADRLQERQAFDVADRAADLHQHEVEVARCRGRWLP